MGDESAVSVHTGASPTETVLACIDTWRRAPLPAEVSARTRQVVLDTIACYIGATAMDAGRRLLAFAERSSGPATLFPLRHRVSAEAASFAASSMANLLDADEALFNRGHHACAIVMPALIVGGVYGTSVDDAMRAIAIGFEVAARVSLSWSYYTVESDGSVRGADVTGLSWIVLGAAASIGLLRDLDGDAMRSALGIAAYGAPIPTNSNWHVAYPPDSMTKYTLYGALAQHAVSAVELAALGFVGCQNVLDGPRGFRRLIGATTWDDDVLRDGLAGTWTIVQTGLKRYPACRLWHGALYGLEQLVRAARLAPADVRHVEIDLALLHPTQMRLAREYPELTEISAQFSVPYGAAQVIERRPLGPAWYRPDALSSERTRELMRRIDVAVDPVMNKEAAEEVKRVGHYGFRLPWAVSVTPASGTTLRASGTNAPGDPFVPALDITPRETEEKFREFYQQARGTGAPPAFLRVLDAPDATCAELLGALG